jgi:hypothetical protein
MQFFKSNRNEKNVKLGLFQQLMKKLKKDEQKFVKKKITMKTYLCFKLIF